MLVLHSGTVMDTLSAAFLLLTSGDRRLHWGYNWKKESLGTVILPVLFPYSNTYHSYILTPTPPASYPHIPTSSHPNITYKCQLFTHFLWCLSVVFAWLRLLTHLLIIEPYILRITSLLLLKHAVFVWLTTRPIQRRANHHHHYRYHCPIIIIIWLSNLFRVY